MKTYCYHNEIKILLTQVLNALGDVIIRQLDEQDDSTYQDQIHVNLVYAPKQRVLFDLVNKNQHIQLPVMALTMSNLVYDDQRAFNKIHGFSVSQHYLSGGGNFPQPVPINMGLNFSIMARYQRHIDQILTCIFSNFFPYIIISYKHPDLGHEVRCCVEWDKSINLEYPVDIDATKPYRVIANSSFKVLGWIYRNASNPYGIIYNIPTTYTAVSNIFDDYEIMHGMEGDRFTDYFVVSGRPQVNNITPFQLKAGQDVQFTIMGDMLQRLSGIFVSGTDGVFDLSSYGSYDLFNGYKNLSALYTPFTALSVATWNKIDDYHATFTLPTPLTTGYVDVIAWSDIGLGYLTQDSVRPTFNPYPSSVPQYATYVEPQWPCVSGIIVK